jgi:glycosyltransferase involved in cell wall biosynthesis
MTSVANMAKSRVNEAFKVAYAIVMRARDAYSKGRRLAVTGHAEAIDDYNIKCLNMGKHRLPISAIVRCRNVQHTLWISVSSIVDYVSEIWIIDNGSTDSSRMVMEQLHEVYPDQVRLSTYDIPLAPAGISYSKALQAGAGSLADYYNFCFALGTQKYLLKWDADMVATTTLYGLLKKVVIRDVPGCVFDGYDLMGVYSSSLEERMFRSDLKWRFVDQEFWEALEIERHSVHVAAMPVYFHLKNLF